MYINLKNLLKLKEPKVICLLLILSHATKKDVSKEVDDLKIFGHELDELEDAGYIKLIKGKKGQDYYQRLRLDKKGKKYLEDLGEVEVEEGDQKMFEYLTEMYLNSDDEERHIGNKKKTQLYCATFRQKLELSLHQMFWLCDYFLKEFTHTKRLQYIFFNPNKNRYGKFENNMEDSPLYQFYDTNKENVEKYWRIKEEARKKKLAEENKL